MREMVKKKMAAQVGARSWQWRAAVQHDSRFFFSCDVVFWKELFINDRLQQRVNIPVERCKGNIRR